VFDLSGNAREWTNTTRGTDIYELRGGSFNNVEAGRTCEFDFTVADQTFRHPNTGFRCCFY
jgi:formylglycine-generating enzyme required for sulfatase activity